MLFEKTECLASTYKSGSLRDKLPKRTRYIYIYISEFFILIISLNASYGHNIFTKISQLSKMTRYIYIYIYIYI